ncbi:hypothetical protein NDU88_003427 [Pleurodeles waltl]|uniref:Uncharacterized protein n=1 Tax=Pleurodeles waltl TaxID=8319 RepID=A0AAV7WUT1_PLEWA|nr:hypothetical protein NDU88_003427 [Pleurodeles waltl]
MDRPKRLTDWTRKGETGSEVEQEETGEQNANTTSMGIEEANTDIPDEEGDKGDRYRDTKEEEETVED